MADDSNDKKDEKGGVIGEAVKKVFTAGVTAAFMTEEGIRGYLADLKLPKEILNVVIQGAAKQKEEITGRVTKEISNVLSKIDIVKEMSKFAENHKFKITAEIEVLPKKKDQPKEEDDKA